MIATAHATQLTHIGIEVCPKVIGTLIKARAICRMATRLKIMAASSEYWSAVIVSPVAV